MMKTAASEYGYINAKLRASLSKILTEDFRLALINSENIEGAVQVLSSNGYSMATTMWNNTGDIQSVEFELLKRYIDSFRRVIKNTEGHLREFSKSLSLRPEIENIKDVIRLWYGSNIKERPIGYRGAFIYKEVINQRIDWDGIINAGSWEDIQAVFSKTIYNEIFQNFQIDGRDDTLFGLETALDRLYYSRLLDGSAFLKKRDADVVKSIIFTEIDLQNIGWLIRYRYFYKMKESDINQVLIPGGYGINSSFISKTDDVESFQPADLLKKSYPQLASFSLSGNVKLNSKLQLFEQLLDEIRRQEFDKMLCGYPFTIGIVLVYLFMSEREYRFISSVLNAKYYKIPTNKLEEYVL